MRHGKAYLYDILKRLLLFGGLWSVTLLLFMSLRWYMAREEAQLLKNTGTGVYELKTSEKGMLFAKKLESLRKNANTTIGECCAFTEQEAALEEATLADEIDKLLAKQFMPVTEAFYMGKAESVGGFTSVSCDAGEKGVSWNFAVLFFTLPDLENLEGLIMYDYDTKQIFGLHMGEASFVDEIWESSYAEESLRQAITDYYVGLSVNWDNQEITSRATRISIWEENLTDDALLMELVSFVENDSFAAQEILPK